MAEDSTNKFGSRDEVADAASGACTRSGAFALLLSMALFTMIPYWQRKAEQTALANYVELRLNLAGALERLDGNPNWQIYKASNSKAESMTIAQLLKVQVLSKPTEKKEPVVNIGDGPAPPGASRSVPVPPTNLRLAMPIAQIPMIADLLVKLDDSQLLTKSRNVSMFYNYLIFRWAIKRYGLVSRNLAASSVVGEAIPNTKAPDNFVPPLGEELLLNDLTLEDVRELGSFALPPLSDGTSLAERGEEEIEIKPGALPQRLYAATFCVECLLLFVVVYFGAFASEAVSSATFPAPGTVFHAFAQSTGTVFVFGTALCVPVIASVGVLFASRKWMLLLPTALTAWAAYWICRVLQRKRFFGDFDQMLPVLKRVFGVMPPSDTAGAPDLRQ